MKRFFILALLLASTAFAQEDKCIALLKSDASTKDKAAACRELTRRNMTAWAFYLKYSMFDNIGLDRWYIYHLSPGL